MMGPVETQRKNDPRGKITRPGPMENDPMATPPDSPHPASLDGAAKVLLRDDPWVLLWFPDMQILAWVDLDSSDFSAL